MENKNDENLIQTTKVRTDEYFKVKIIETIPGDGTYQAEFIYLEDDLKTENGNRVHYKYKDPRDLLNFLVNSWKLLSPVESHVMFIEYCTYGLITGKFNPKEVYYYLMLELVFRFNFDFAVFNPLPESRFDRNLSVETLKEYTNILKTYDEELNSQTRIAHIFAVKNTWMIWNHYNQKVQLSGEYAPTKKEIEACTKREPFHDKYLGKQIKFATGFNLNMRMWQVFFEDNSWILTYDVGNGWYEPLTKFNDLKLMRY